MIEPLSERDDDPLAKLVVHARELDVDYDVEAGLTRHRAAVASLPTGSALSQLLTPTKVIIAAIVLTVGAAAAWRLLSHDDEALPIAHAGAAAAPREPSEATTPREPSDATTPRQTSHRSAPSVARAEPPPASDSLASEAPPRRDAPHGRAQGDSSAAGKRPTAATKPSSPPADDDALAREASQLNRARALLESGDAEAALALCDASAREFPRGTFVPERTGIRVLALHALGRPHEAAARAWLSKWPDGPLATRIRRTLDR